MDAGTRIGGYEIIAELGRGGMGEVYRARDTKLDRAVALKILPESFASDPDRLMRFEREAKTLASLNHPNIAAIYGIEERALVMELVEGRDLSELIGGLALEDALAIARQIADALDAAHGAGIVHRDLKPANIKVRDDGTVKVLDFGLAKAMDPPSPGATAGEPGSAMNSPTMTSPAMTQMGMILGTAAYMSPEQAKGRAVDKRADIWAFGVVLYEMLTGGRAFAGEDVSDLLVAVLSKDVDFAALPAGTPVSVIALLRRCLERDPRHRLRDIGDARHQLDARDATPSGAQSAARSGWAAVAPWVIAAAAVIAALAVAVPTWLRPAASATPGVQFVVPVPVAVGTVNPVLSTDGTFLVYDTDRLYIRRLSEFEPHELPGTANADQPFISPDGKWVGFYADGKMKKVAVAGGEPQTIIDASAGVPGASFVSNDRIVFTAGWNGTPLLSVSANGGAVTSASTLDASANERGHWWPRVLPDGRHVLFTIWYAAEGLQASHIAVLDLDTGTHQVLFPGAMAQYAAGHLLYYRAGQYHVVPFDPSSRSTTGDSRPVLADALGLNPSGGRQDPVSVSATGAVAYWPGDLYPPMTLTWVDRTGRRTPTSLTFGVNDADLASDDRHVAVGRPEGGTSQMWVYDLQGGEQRLSGEGNNFSPVWHPDGLHLAYTSVRKGDFDIVTQALGAAQVIAIAGDLDEAPSDWLPDDRLLVMEWLTNGATSIFLSGPEGGDRTSLVTGPFSKGYSRVSPDGRWLALCANPSGGYSVNVRRLEGSGGLQHLAPAEDECTVRWSAGTKELVYIRGTALVALAHEERSGRLEVVRTTTLATLPPRSELYGVSQDGQRVLVGIPASPPPATPGIRVIVNGIGALR